MDKFDNMFFGIPPRQVNFMDPRHRIILETTFECIIDAGYNPVELKNSRTGKICSSHPIKRNQLFSDSIDDICKNK